MRFYTGQHRHYCGVDLHARSIYVCVLDRESNKVLHRNLRADPDVFLEAVQPFSEDLVVGAECMFTWYWLADLCRDAGIPFVLGHALYMKAIHGGKAKNDRIDSAKIADRLDRVIHDLEAFLTRRVKVHDSDGFHRLRSIPGVGKILAMTLLYEIHDIERFPRVQDFASYARLVKCVHESAGKRSGTGGAKIGNAYLRWAFGEAVLLMLRDSEELKKRRQRLERKHGNGKSLAILAHKLGRAVYFMMKRKRVFQMERFLAA